MDANLPEPIWFVEEVAEICRITPSYLYTILYRYKDDFPRTTIPAEGGPARRILTTTEVWKIRELLSLKARRPVRLTNRYAFLGICVG